MKINYLYRFVASSWPFILQWINCKHRNKIQFVFVGIQKKKTPGRISAGTDGAHWLAQANVCMCVWYDIVWTQAVSVMYCIHVFNPPLISLQHVTPYLTQTPDLYLPCPTLVAGINWHSSVCTISPKPQQACSTMG